MFRMYVLLFIAIWAGACGDSTYRSCESDADCPTGAICTPNECRSSAKLDAGAANAGTHDGNGPTSDSGATQADSGSTEMDAGVRADAGGDTGVPRDGSPGPDGGESDATGGAPDAGDTADDVVPCGKVGDLSAASGVLIDLGHTANIVSVTKSGNRILSSDSDGHWVLWDATSRAIVAEGDTANVGSLGSPLYLPPALAGSHFVLASSDSALQFRSAVNATVLTTQPTVFIGQRPFGIAVDGSYFWAATATSFTAWNSSGTVVASALGDYRPANIWAAPGEVRIANGAAANNAIQRISTATGMSSLSATFAGTFHSWFRDGGHFFTNASTTVRVYSPDAVQAAIVSLPSIENLTGQGAAFWIYQSIVGSPLDIYLISDTTAPAKSYNLRDLGGDNVRVSGNVLLVPASTAKVSLIDLSEPGMPVTSVTVPRPYPKPFGGESGAAWFVASGGVLYESSNFDQPLSCGRARSIAGSATGIIAIATEAAGVFLFRINADRREYLGRIRLDAGEAQLSANGSILGVAAELSYADVRDDRSISVFSLPSKELIKTWPYKHAPPFFAGFVMSADGGRIAHVFNPTATKIFDFVGTDPLFLKDVGPVVLSADGSHVAAPTGPLYVPESASNIYLDGTLVSAVPGYPLAWLDDERLLVEEYGENVAPWSQVYNASGALEPGASLPSLGKVQVISPNEIYSVRLNAIYSLTSRTQTWSGGGAGGAVAGAQVVWRSGSKLVTQPY